MQRLDVSSWPFFHMKELLPQLLVDNSFKYQIFACEEHMIYKAEFILAHCSCVCVCVCVRMDEWL